MVSQTLKFAVIVLFFFEKVTCRGKILDLYNPFHYHIMIRCEVMLLILGAPSFQNHFRPFLSQKLGGPTLLLLYSEPNIAPLGSTEIQGLTKIGPTL